MAHPWYETAALPPALRARIAERYRLFAGVTMEESGGGDAGGGDAGGDGGGDAGGGTGEGTGAATVDLSQVTLEQLKEHPDFQNEINRVVKERVGKEKDAWQKKLDDAAAAANLTAEQRAEAEKQAAADQLAAEKARSSAAFQLVAQTQAQVIAVQAGGRPDRSAAIAAQADLSAVVDEDGTVDTAAIKAAVTKVLRDFPEWKSDGTKADLPSTSGGELTGGTQAPSFTKSQIEQMSESERLRRWPEIEKAMTEGRFDYAR
ncbi:MAG TPA: hypothetical protein VFV01_47690 [Spirillospora sp.]|nr:hypothetical protein [Spirillospora sp.]